MMFLSCLIHCNTRTSFLNDRSTDLHPSQTPHFKSFQVRVFLMYFPKCPTFIKAMFQTYRFTSLILKLKFNLLVKSVIFFFNTVFAMAILYLISSVHHSSFATMLPEQLQYSTFSVDVFYHKPIFNCHTTRTTV